ncbi:unnamed protein product [Cyclocybe aegerita]|uniref:Uncharacterized protein n=1 Tax=Cyclocybe aegerita TaxID=1973307 RepID=A0A8S0WKD7_CYCAE|nr:unnamed protein product [Cyclocybe aegerita]
MADQDGDVFWDAVEGPDAMDDRDGVPMESDDLRHIIPRKRSRSPSEVPTNGPVTMPIDSEASRYTRQPKRQRRTKDIPDYNALPDQNVLMQIGRSNPLNRRTLKKDAKRARKSHRIKNQLQSSPGKMEIDDEGLQFTFMA